MWAEAAAANLRRAYPVVITERMSRTISWRKLLGWRSKAGWSRLLI
jgi:hypothetical protein